MKLKLQNAKLGIRFFRKALFIVVLVLVFILNAEASEEDISLLCWGRGNSLVLDLIYMFPEAEQAVIAMGNSNQTGGSFQKLLDKNYSAKAVLDMELQPETVAAYNPTHILLKSYMRKAAANVEKLGIPVLFIDMESPEQYDADLTRMGELFDNKKRADELKNFFRTERLEVIDIVDQITEKERRKVLFLYYSLKGGSASLKVPPSDWLQTRMIEWAGGKPVWSDTVNGKSWQTVSFEQIAAWNPDTVFLVSYHGDVEAARDRLLSDPLWKMIDAGKSGRIYAFPGDFLSWDQPTPRWVLGLNWIGTKLHPEIFSLKRLDKKIYEFYETAYGFNRDDVEQEIIPRIRGDYR